MGIKSYEKENKPKRRHRTMEKSKKEMHRYWEECW